MSHLPLTIHVGDVGTVFRLTVQEWDEITEEWIVLDVSSASVTKNIHFYHPDGTKISKAATFTTDGTDGQIEYKTLVGDTDLMFPAGLATGIGLWGLRAEVDITGWSGHSDREPVNSFEVKVV